MLVTGLEFSKHFTDSPLDPEYYGSTPRKNWRALPVFGIVGRLVEDFLMAGDLKDDRWLRTREKIREIYKWGSVNSGKFRFVGIDYTQNADYSISCDQAHYAEGLGDLEIPTHRLQHDNNVLTKFEEAACRNKLGELHWLVVSSMPLLSARVGLLLSSVKEGAPMQVARDIQTLLAEAKQTSSEIFMPNLVVKYWKDVVFCCFPDASLHTRPQGGSIGGYILLVAETGIQQGELVQMAPIVWRSWKLERKAVGTNDGEIQSMHVGEDALFRVRLLWGEIHGTGLPHTFDFISRVEAASDAIDGILATDSKGGYDAIMKNDSPNLGLANARSAVQVCSLKQSLSESTLSLKWLAADCNRCDALAKNNAESRRWRLKFVPNFIVAAKKAKRGALKEIDDEVEQKDARFLESLLTKHGDDAFKTRLGYLLRARQRV